MYIAFEITIIMSNYIIDWRYGNIVFGDKGVLLVVTLLFPFVPEIITWAITMVSNKASGYSGLLSGIRGSATIIRDMRIMRKMVRSELNVHSG